MDPLDDSCCWDLLDYNFLVNDIPPTDYVWSNPSVSPELDFSAGTVASQENTRKRRCTSSCSEPGTKACREKLRRERLNDKFSDLSAVLEPGRPVKTDKPSILDDAIRVLNQLKTEGEELKQTNEQLLEEIKCFEAEKNELSEDKLLLKADKEKIESQLKAMPISPAGFLPPHAAPYQAGMNEMTVFPGYSFVPMWQYLPSSACDTSHDQELRPPAA